jgi:hypothetical protein
MTIHSKRERSRPAVRGFRRKTDQPVAPLTEVPAWRIACRGPGMGWPNVLPTKLRAESSGLSPPARGI